MIKKLLVGTISVTDENKSVARGDKIKIPC